MVCRAEGINSQNQNLKPERRKEEIARDNYHRRKFCRSHKAIRFSFSLISFSKSLPCMYVRMYVCKSVYLNTGNHQLSTFKTNYNCFTWLPCGNPIYQLPS